MTKGKPVALIIFDGLLLLAGMMNLLTIMVFAVAMFDPLIVENVHLGAREWIVGLYDFVISIIYLFFLLRIFLYGKDKQWGRIVFLYIVTFDIVSAAVKNLFLARSLTFTVPVIVFNCVVLFYFTRPKVMAQFKNLKSSVS